MVGELRPFGELFAEGTRNGLTRPKAVRGAGVKMVNMGELFAHSRIKNAAMDRVPLNDAEAENSCFTLVTFCLQGNPSSWRVRANVQYFWVMTNPLPLSRM
jgi:hypothetical protein